MWELPGTFSCSRRPSRLPTLPFRGLSTECHSTPIRDGKPGELRFGRMQEWEDRSAGEESKRESYILRGQLSSFPLVTVFLHTRKFYSQLVLDSGDFRRICNTQVRHPWQCEEDSHDSRREAGWALVSWLLWQPLACLPLASSPHCGSRDLQRGLKTGMQMYILLEDESCEIRPSKGQSFPKSFSFGCLFYGSAMLIHTSAFTSFCSFASVSSFSFHQDGIHTGPMARTIPLIHMR